MRKTRHIFILCLFLTVLSGQTARSMDWGIFKWLGFSAGAEWGYTNTIAESHHINFHNVIGMTIDDRGHNAMYHVNGYIMLHGGLEFFDKFELSAIYGYEGLNRERRGTYLAARASYYVKGCHTDGIFIFGEEGFYNMNTHLDKLTSGLRLGLGYRFALTKKMNLNFNVSGHLTKDSPLNVMDKAANTEIPAGYINISDATYAGISLSAGLSF